MVFGPRLAMLLGVTAAAASCSPFSGGGSFACTDDGQCAASTPGGQCESDGFCSFPDGACASGRRYGAASGATRSNVCVGEVGVVDGSLDGASDGGIDAATDAPLAAFCDAAGEPTLVGCWEFENTTTDASGDGNNATATNTTFSTGKVGAGLTLQASSLVAAGDGASLSPPTLTIEAWIRPTVLPTTGARMGVADNDGAYGLFLNPTGLSCSVSIVAAATVTIPTGAWTHVACTFDGTTGRLYVNGVQAAMTAGGTNLGTGNTNGLVIGGNSPNGDQLIGTIDQVRVWNVARSAAQVCTAAGATGC